MSVKPLSQLSKAVTPVYAEIPVAANVKAENPQEEGKEQKRAAGPLKINREDAEAVAGVMNKASEMLNNQLQFEVYEETNTVYVQIVDRKTKEVVKQIPPEEMLELSAKIREMVGILIDKYV